MQKAMLIKDDQTLANLNQILSEDQFMITKITGGSDGTYMVVLDDEDYDNLEDMFDLDEK